MPGSIGEEDDLTRSLKRREQMYDMARKGAETEKSPKTGKLGSKRIRPENASENLSNIANKRFKAP